MNSTTISSTSLEPGCARACTPCKGSSCPNYARSKQPHKPSCEGADVVQETVDAISGATWTTRNMIMEELFQQDLNALGDEMPSYKTPWSVEQQPLLMAEASHVLFVPLKKTE